MTANLTDEEIAAQPFDLYRQGYEYYWRTHAHPRSTFRHTMSSLLDLMRFDATEMGRGMSEIVAYGTARVVAWDTAPSGLTGAS